jgi:hypothetical protein
MTHFITGLDLDENERGEMVIPSEKDNIVAECTLRQFLIQANRNYSQEALERITGMKVRVNQTAEDIDLFDDSERSELVLIDFMVQPETSLQEFVDDKGDEFFDELMGVLGYCDLRGVRGKRAVFVTEFKKTVLAGGVEVLAAKILLSTSVFFNDYRVTVAYPHEQDELDTVVENIYNRISNRFPEMKFETSGEFVGETEEA